MLRAMANRKAKLVRALDGQVALVTGGGKGYGRAVALALAARGVRVVVTGRVERALGETVGEIANAGGKARHLAGDVRDAAHLRAAVARAIDVFGALDIVIATASLSGPEALDARVTFDAALAAMTGTGRLVAVRAQHSHDAHDATPPGASPDAANEARWQSSTSAPARDVAARGITSNAVTVVQPQEAPLGVDHEKASVEPEEVAEIVVFLCSSAANAISGQALVLGAV